MGDIYESSRRELRREAIIDLRERIWRHYAEAGRSFPWRETENEYEILVSELMLQQTQTDRVMKKYRPFLDLFPDYRSLARGSTRDILAVWQGLGYNRRALALREIAARVVERGGRLPAERDELLSLPMIGPGTAGSLQAFVFNMPSVFIETNIRRVVIHHFFPGEERVSDRRIMPLVEKLLDRGNPRHWYYAFMDYGVELKKRVENPNRRSSHYRRQESFEGSNRQLRGRILGDLVSKGGALSYQELSRLRQVPKDRLDTCLAGLESEGFLVREADESYRLSE